MKISIFGLGYVGCIMSGCLTKMGNKVIGLDIDNAKVEQINNGIPTIMENGINELIADAHEKRLLEATNNIQYAVLNTDISFIVVGTPNKETGELNLEYVYEVAKKIGIVLKNKKTFHTIVIRSTVIPGTNEYISNLIGKYSNKIIDKDFSVVSNPEFIREGTAIDDFFNPPYTLIGSNNILAIKKLKQLYKDINSEVIVSDVKIAEIIKYINNAYHALKIDFANEIGNICKSINIDSHKVMDIFCKDNILNISPYYFKPGFAFGGSCLPKDTKALMTLAQNNNINTPILNSILTSNEIQKNNALDIIKNKNKKNIGIFGLSFKSNTDDLRFSPIIDVINKLIKEKYNIKIYDKNVFLSLKNNINKKLIMKQIPNIYELIYEDINYVIDESDIIVIANKEKEFEILNKYHNKIIVDLVRQWNNPDNKNYEGISWNIE